MGDPLARDEWQAGVIAAAAGFPTPLPGAPLQEAIDAAVLRNALRALRPGQDETA
jgi:hypothetical protein